MRYNSLNVLRKPALWCVSGKAEYSMDDLKRHRTYLCESVKTIEGCSKSRRKEELTRY